MSEDIRTMVRTDPRRAGAVRRYHTWPTIQTQTVAESSWNVTRILLMIWPDAPPQAISHALLNDCGEIRSGDLPFPIKRDNPVLKAEISRIEDMSLAEQGIAELAQSPVMWPWTQRVKICDMIEMLEFGMEEVAMGNRYAEPIVEGTTESVMSLIDLFGLSAEDAHSIMEYLKWRTTKTPAARA